MTKPPLFQPPAPDENSSDENLSPELIASHLVLDANFQSDDEVVEAEIIDTNENEQALVMPASRSPFDSLLARRSRSHPEILVAGAFVAVVCAGAGWQYWLHRNDTPPVVAPMTRTVTPTANNAQLVSAADTLLIKQNAGATYSTLRGTMRSAGVVTGQAPMSGQVSRVMFKVGQNVQVGDRILTLTGGPIAAAPRGVERQQDRAEAAQVAAVKGQQSVANQISGAQTSYQEAKLRVEAAEKRLGEARTVLSRLRNGEQIPLTATSQNANQSAPKPTRKRARRKTANKTEVKADPQRATAHRERDAAIAAAVKAQKAAETATGEAKAAFRAAAATDNVVRTKRARVESARTALREIENQFAAGKNKASDVDTARGELASAQAEADETLDKTKVARETSNRLESEAESARKVSQQATERAAAALQKLQLFAATPSTTASAQDTPAPNTASEATPDKPRLMTARDAVNMIRSAVEEGEAAARNARKWKVQIDSYGDKIKKTSQRIEDSSAQLMKAQQRVMDVTIERNLAVVRAPATGIIQSIAPVADNVASGDALVRIGSGRGIEVVFSDSSGLWRRLKPGMTLTATAHAPQSSNQSSSQGATKTSATPLAAPPAMEIPVVLKVQDIDAPEPRAEIKKDNKKDDKKPAPKVEPALIRAAVELAPNAKARLRNGMGVLCSLPGVNAQSAIHIPEPAIWRDGNQAMVAVLEPVVPPVTPVAQVSNLVASNEVEINAAMFRVAWRPVALVAQKAGQSAAQRLVLSGLQPGDRILRRAADWRQWSQINGENATVRVALS